LIGRLTYQPLLVKIARKFRINRFIRDVYCRLACPKDKIINISLFDIQAKFYINTPVELRIIEASLTQGMGERLILEKLFYVLQQGDVFYDIGASLGTHTIFMAKRVGKNGSVISIEPECESFRKLQENIYLNDLKNVISIQTALGNNFHKGFFSSYGGGFGTYNLLDYGKKDYNKRIKIVPGDYIIKNRNLSVPNVVKIDVEGYEYYVLQGLKETLRKTVCRTLCIEIHHYMLPKDVTPEMIINLLRSSGFNYFEKYERGETFHLFCSKGNLKNYKKQ